MNHLHLILVSALLLVGCGDQPTAREKAESDATAVAAVEAAQDRQPPVVPITPEPLSAEELRHVGLSGARCEFRPDGAVGDRPVIIAGPEMGLAKVNGRLAVFAADTASRRVYDAYADYAGRAFGLHLEANGGIGSNEGGDRRGRMTLTDQFERPVYTATGSFACGA